jgi:hypothetical protein
MDLFYFDAKKAFVGKKIRTEGPIMGSDFRLKACVHFNAVLIVQGQRDRK